MRVETLESRRLLSVTVAQQGTTLYVHGGGGDDVITVIEGFGQEVNVFADGGSTPVGGGLGVTLVVLDARGGSDTVDLFLETVSADVSLQGGNDTLTGTFGFSTGDYTGVARIFGGGGGDTIVVDRFGSTGQILINPGGGDDFVLDNGELTTG